MLDPQLSLKLLTPGGLPDAVAVSALGEVPFDQAVTALKRLREIPRNDQERAIFSHILPTLAISLEEAATPDISLINLEQYLGACPDRIEILSFLANQPRAVEILVRLFVGSQYLTGILMQNPKYLPQLTQHNRLAEIKSRQQFVEEGRIATDSARTWSERLISLRHFQQWELLRIAACDTFGLMDFKATTLQLSLLADGITQLALRFAAEETRVDPGDFVVLALGKLGGEELNYSSDIDLVFVSREGGPELVPLAQRLIRALSEPTTAGFLYRVDMRLRPWGQAGALVTTVASWSDYLRRHGRLWEKQALLKARPIAGDLSLGRAVLRELDSQIYQVDAEAVRQNVRQMKQEIELSLTQHGLPWNEVKGGPGGIRDIEFLTQSQQLIHGSDLPEVRSINTLDGLVRLADRDFIHANEYRQLASGYVFLRTVEHSLQLLYNKQEHALPSGSRELTALAKRIDFPGPTEFLAYHDQHRREIRKVFDKYLGDGSATISSVVPVDSFERHLGAAATKYRELFSEDRAARDLALLARVDAQHPVCVAAQLRDPGQWELTIAGYDQIGDLSLICGVLLAREINIEAGDVLTGSDLPPPLSGQTTLSVAPRRKFINVFQVAGPVTIPNDFWKEYEQELTELWLAATPGSPEATQGRLIRRLASIVRFEPESRSALLPLHIVIDNDSSPEATILRITGEDSIGFLYELSNALALSGISIVRVSVRSEGRLARDTLAVTDEQSRKITDPGRIAELRTTITLIKHFTHLLPQSPNPEAALRHFREFLSQFFARVDWSEQVASLGRSDVLTALSRVLGVSDFLWEEFLRQQQPGLVPLVTQTDGGEVRTREELATDLHDLLSGTTDYEDQRRRLNDFKDREMLRVDMRHILGDQDTFRGFSQELTDVGQVVVQAALDISQTELSRIHGLPHLEDGRACRLSVCALGKFAGCELGFASDIELMFLFEGSGMTTGRVPLTNQEYYERLIDLFVKSIHARRKGIFEIDLRLRPYGKAGSPAVLLDTFRRYFAAEGAAWPFERQALVKFRPLIGDPEFNRQIVEERDKLIFAPGQFDVAAMRAMRDKQIRQLVQPGTFNAKLSPGGLVDIEYLVQGLQLLHGGLYPQLRTANTREAMRQLEAIGVLSTEQRLGLKDAYRFLRRLIDALRMVRGDARDLTVPPMPSDEFRFLARRMRLFRDSTDLVADLESYTVIVRDLCQSLLPSSN